MSRNIHKNADHLWDWEIKSVSLAPGLLDRNWQGKMRIEVEGKNSFEKMGMKIGDQRMKSKGNHSKSNKLGEGYVLKPSTKLEAKNGQSVQLRNKSEQKMEYRIAVPHYSTKNEHRKPQANKTSFCMAVQSWMKIKQRRQTAWRIATSFANKKKKRLSSEGKINSRKKEKKFLKFISRDDTSGGSSSAFYICNQFGGTNLEDIK